MKLYHGTNEECTIEIFTEGKLSAGSWNVSYATKLINKVLEKHLGKNPRENAVYMWRKIEYIDISEKYAFEIDTDELDVTNLYVGDFNTVNDLYHHVNSSISSIDSVDFFNREKVLAEKYKKSFVSFDEYIKIKDKYEKEYVPEFLYFGNIEIKRDEDYIEYLESGYDVII